MRDAAVQSYLRGLHAWSGLRGSLSNYQSVCEALTTATAMAARHRKCLLLHDYCHQHGRPSPSVSALFIPRPQTPRSSSIEPPSPSWHGKRAVVYDIVDCLSTPPQEHRPVFLVSRRYSRHHVFTCPTSEVPACLYADHASQPASPIIKRHTEQTGSESFSYPSPAELSCLSAKSA